VQELKTCWVKLAHAATNTEEVDFRSPGEGFVLESGALDMIRSWTVRQPEARIDYQRAGGWEHTWRRAFGRRVSRCATRPALGVGRP
jgi:hypothetical protein